ncbi:IPTL-CTERM sorting domain-containing protein [Comamonas sp. MYb69]|uniref:IPTL-CTERM sorting domain-containing protein n=1 Tax=Comamonas sp. MYb69 TaxID=1848650 RepID=UPI0030B6E573
MKKRFTPPARYALLTACLLSGWAQAQSINFTDDTNPTGNMGASYTAASVSVGTTGRGALTVIRGGQLTSEEATIGDAVAGEGAVEVSDRNSVWNFASAAPKSLTIGNYGAGALFVRQGATVSVMWTLQLSRWPGSSAAVTVDNPNSILKAGDCLFGPASFSNVMTSEGGLLHCQRSANFSNGELRITGTDSKFLADNNFSIGEGPTQAGTTVNIFEGGALNAGGVITLHDSAPGIPDSPLIYIEGRTNPGVVTASSLRFEGSRKGLLNLNHSNDSGNYQLTPDLDGDGQINVNNYGITTLTGENTNYRGITRINSGVLRAGATNSLSPSSDFVVAPGGTLDTSTYSSTVKSLENGGTITMADGGTSSVLTVAQNYTGNGGEIVMNTALGDSSSPTEKLVVQGDTSGSTTLNISNLGGTGAQTSGNGILVVQVDGASNGTFSLPAPGYVEAGGLHYVLVKVGANWYLQSDNHVEAASPEASVVCTPAELSDTANQVATCTVTLTAAPTADLPINLVLPAANPRFTTTCASPLMVPANATQASCTITATPNTTAGDGDVSLELAIAPPTTADAYTPAGPAAQVLIKDAGDTTTQPPATLKQVPTLGSFGLAALAALMGAVGLRRSRKTV